MIEIPEEPGFGVDVDERFLYDFTYNENITVNKVLNKSIHQLYEFRLQKIIH